jgi:hypothetical protein
VEWGVVGGRDILEEMGDAGGGGRYGMWNHQRVDDGEKDKIWSVKKRLSKIKNIK